MPANHILDASFSWRHFNADEVERQISHMPNLQKLDVSHNIIERTPQLPQSLVVLNLSFNPRCESLAGLSSSNLVKLRILILTNNNLTSVKGLLTLPCLEKLDVSHNRLSTLNGLEFLPQLKVLIAVNNHINQMTSLRCLSCSKALEVLDLRGNPVCESSDYTMIKNFVVPTLGILDGRRYKARAFAPSSTGKLQSNVDAPIHSSSKAITSIDMRAAPHKALIDARIVQKRSSITGALSSGQVLNCSGQAFPSTMHVTPNKPFNGSYCEASPILNERLVLEFDKSRPVTGYTAQYLNSTRGLNKPDSAGSASGTSSALQGVNSQNSSLYHSSPITRNGSNLNMSHTHMGVGGSHSNMNNSSSSSISTAAAIDYTDDGTIFNGNGKPRSNLFRSAIHKPGVRGSTGTLAGNLATGRRPSSRYDDLYADDHISTPAAASGKGKGKIVQSTSSGKVTASAGTVNTTNGVRPSTVNRKGMSPAVATATSGGARRASSADGKRRGSAGTGSGNSTPRGSATYYYDIDTVFRGPTGGANPSSRNDQSLLSHPYPTGAEAAGDSRVQRSPVPWRNAPTIKPRPWRGLHWNEDWEESDKWVPTAAQSGEQFVNQSQWIGGNTIAAYNKNDKNISNKNELKQRLIREKNKNINKPRDRVIVSPSQRDRDALLSQGSSPYKHRNGGNSGGFGERPNDVFGFGFDGGSNIDLLNVAATPLVSSNGRIYNESLWIANGRGIVGIPNSLSSRSSPPRSPKTQMRQQQPAELDVYQLADASDINLASQSYQFAENYRNALVGVGGGDDFHEVEPELTNNEVIDLDISQLTTGTGNGSPPRTRQREMQVPTGVRIAQDYFYGADDEVILDDASDEEGAAPVGYAAQSRACMDRRDHSAASAAESVGSESGGSQKSGGSSKHYAQATFTHAMHKSPVTHIDPRLVAQKAQTQRSTSPPRAKASLLTLGGDIIGKTARESSQAVELSRSSESQFEYSLDESSSGSEDMTENLFFAHTVVEPDLSVTSFQNDYVSRSGGGVPGDLAMKHTVASLTAMTAPVSVPDSEGSNLSDVNANANNGDNDINIVLENLRKKKEQAFSLLQAKLEKFS